MRRLLFINQFDQGIRETKLGIGILAFGGKSGAAYQRIIGPEHQGEGVEEKGYDKGGKCIVAVDAGYFRPTEVDSLLGDAAKARQQLGWKPKVSFTELVTEMAREDLIDAERDLLVKKHGYTALRRHE